MKLSVCFQEVKTLQEDKCMVNSAADEGNDASRLLRLRNDLLTKTREYTIASHDSQTEVDLLEYSCKLMAEAFQCEVWAGNFCQEEKNIRILGSSQSSPPSTLLLNVQSSLLQRYGRSMESFKEPFTFEYTHRQTSLNSVSISCHLWPIRYKDSHYGFICMLFPAALTDALPKHQFMKEFLDCIGLAFFSQETALKLKAERDFNKEIIDTIQALMVTIHPCGTIISINKRAEEITGYSQADVYEKYWVDVLISPAERLEYQQQFSNILKGTQDHINFTAPLLTSMGQVKQISWQGFIRHNIDQGQIGLVMIGIDETENIAVDQQLYMLTTRWEKIFTAIQDPVLVVSNENVIIEANPATFSAAKKNRSEVVGHKLCEILHGGHNGRDDCPLERFIGYQKTQISETELAGLQGMYMLTVTPLIEENGEINATLLVARNLTEEEVLRAETIRAAQLAALGELASGVAHEINNPINGIINYARIILDDPADPEMGDHLQNIVTEGKRIAKIVANLLDFARRGEEGLAPSTLVKVVNNSLELVSHLLKKEGILCTVSIDQSLPPLLCNAQQLQQVVLNLLSNSRYALNKKYQQPCPEKKIHVSGKLYTSGQKKMIRLSITDYGTGIPEEIQKKLFDPFFSTKPSGEGTGLGLSISHGLVRDHGGFIRVASSLGEWTRFSVYLPV